MIEELYMAYRQELVRWAVVMTDDAGMAEFLPLIDEKVKLIVVQKGKEIVPDDAVLDDALIQKYGTKLFIAGDLTLTKDSSDALSKLENLTVEGTVYLLKKQLERFQTLKPDYQELKITKEIAISNKPSAYVDGGLLERTEDGAEVTNCTPEQTSAVEQIAVNVAMIGEPGRETQ